MHTNHKKGTEFEIEEKIENTFLSAAKKDNLIPTTFCPLFLAPQVKYKAAFSATTKKLNISLHYANAEKHHNASDLVVQWFPTTAPETLGGPSVFNKIILTDYSICKKKVFDIFNFDNNFF